MYAATACATCASLRAAALRLVGDRGFHEISADDLCESSGLTPDDLVDHYPTAQACLYDAYDALSADLLRDAADAFECSASWLDALNCSASRMLTRLAERPAEARLLFVEALRGDRELRRRREFGRQRMVALFLAERSRRGDREQLSQIQLETLLGAGFHLIATRVAAGRIGELPELRHELAELAGVFEPLVAAA